ncbi:MAG: 50S ribosomal protein L11 methyltransferase [Kiritimatiellae bacterium]|nr:50S ribosomal protein L11 methyltransferase [Kiritimatiellia bacterium]
MSDDLLTVVSCGIAPEQVDCLFELLDADDFTPTSWYDLEKNVSRIDVFLENAEQAPAVCKALTDAAGLIGIELTPEISKMAKSDWAESWKRFFHVEKISERLVVRPSWEKYDAKPGEKVITLDPGMSFGTGKHETTQACLRFLDRLASENPNRRVIDMGCGSGILAIAAKLLGFSEVTAFDNDPDCIHVTKENAAANGVDFPVTVDDLSHPYPPAGVVVANILAPILVAFAEQVAASVADGQDARLILSGILDEQYPAVRAAYEAQGMRELDTILIKNWRSGLFARSVAS